MDRHYPLTTEEGGHAMGIEFYRAAEWTNANAPAVHQNPESTMACILGARSLATCCRWIEGALAKNYPGLDDARLV